MGVVQSNPTFYHPDLLAVFSINGLNPFKSPKWSRYSDNINDPGWVRNSPLRNELVDLLNDALKAMGGWPKYSGCCCGYHLFQIVPPQLVEAFNKVCKKFNDTKLFGMGLQCRAIIIRHKKNFIENGPQQSSNKKDELLVFVEKRSDEHLHDVGQTHEHLSWLEEIREETWCGGSEMGPQAKLALAWSPPEDWMTRLSPPYNEAYYHSRRF